MLTEDACRPDAGHRGQSRPTPGMNL